MQDVRDDVPDCTVFALVGGKIGEPFCKEAFCVKIQARRTDEHLRIACPAKALVALRAVGRHIEEIALLPQITFSNSLFKSGSGQERYPVRFMSEWTAIAVKFSCAACSAPHGNR